MGNPQRNSNGAREPVATEAPKFDVAAFKKTAEHHLATEIKQRVFKDKVKGSHPSVGKWFLDYDETISLSLHVDVEFVPEVRSFCFLLPKNTANGKLSTQSMVLSVVFTKAGKPDEGTSLASLFKGSNNREFHFDTNAHNRVLAAHFAYKPQTLPFHIQETFEHVNSRPPLQVSAILGAMDADRMKNGFVFTGRSDAVAILFVDIPNCDIASIADVVDDSRLPSSVVLFRLKTTHAIVGFAVSQAIYNISMHVRKPPPPPQQQQQQQSHKTAHKQRNQTTDNGNA